MLAQRFWHHLGHGLVRLGNVLRGECLEARCVEGKFPRQHVVAEDADGVEITASVDVQLARRLLRRHVVRRAEGARRVGAHRIERTQKRDAEVCEHRTASAALEEDVLRLEVAMHDTLAVGVVERERELVQDSPRFLGRQPLLPAQSLGERLTVHVLHHDVDEVALFAEGVHRNDARVAEPRRHPRLAAEPLAMLVARRELVTEHLDRHQPVERDVSGEEDDAHPTTSQLAHDLILLAKVRRDLLAFPRHRCRLWLPVPDGQLERIGVRIDEVSEGAHGCECCVLHHFE